MKKLLVFIGLFIPLCGGAQGNLVFNPGFDETPWDTGWTIEIDTSHYAAANCTSWAHAACEAGAGMSYPNCCSLYIDGGIRTLSGYGSGGYTTKATISQIFSEVVGCEIKAYVKDSLKVTSAKIYCKIQVHVNSIEWKTIWEKCSWSGSDTIWGEICTTMVNDTVSGVRLMIESSYYYGPSQHTNYTARGSFLIDDIYVGKTGVEESAKNKVQNAKLNIYPNPFVQTAIVRLSANGGSASSREDSRVEDCEIKVYDMIGKLVEQTEGPIVGKDLPSGIYFVKAGSYEPLKIIKIGGVR